MSRVVIIITSVVILLIVGGIGASFYLTSKKEGGIPTFLPFFSSGKNTLKGGEGGLGNPVQGRDSSIESPLANNDDGSFGGDGGSGGGGGGGGGDGSGGGVGIGGGSGGGGGSGSGFEGSSSEYEGIIIPPEQIHNCTEPERNAVCDNSDHNVCGWFQQPDIACGFGPCVTLFSNPCNACSNTDVIFWTESECPLHDELITSYVVRG